MWERAPCSCRLEIVFMRDLYLSVSPSSCHCTQWVGAPSEWQKTNTSQPRRVTFHISVIKASRASLRDSGLADVGSMANHSASFTWAVPAPSYFSTLWRHIRSLLNVNTFRAGQESDRETDEGLLKGPVCVCACVCECVCVFVDRPLVRVPSPPQESFHLPRTPWEPASQMWSHFTGNPKFNHLNMVIHTHAMQPPLSLHRTGPRCERGSQDMQFLQCNFFALKVKKNTDRWSLYTKSFAIK